MENSKSDLNNDSSDQTTKNKKSIASRGIPSKEAMFLPAFDSPTIRAFQDGNENQTKNIWSLEEILNFVFPKKYQEKYYTIALSFIKFISEKNKVYGEQIGQFIKENNISKATFYNRVLPRLRRVGLIKIEREFLVEKDSKKKFRPMIISLSKTFGNYLCKIGDSWLAFVDETRSKQDQQKKLI
jgi:hypothetical protein